MERLLTNVNKNLIKDLKLNKVLEFRNFLFFRLLLNKAGRKVFIKLNHLYWLRLGCQCAPKKN